MVRLQLVAILLCFLFSCRKNPQEKLNIPPSPSITALTIGNKEGMLVRTAGLNLLDVDEDGFTDLELKSETFRSAPGGLKLSERITLICLRGDISIRNSKRSDTLFRTEDLVIQPYVWEGTPKTLKSFSIAETCRPSGSIKSFTASIHNRFVNYIGGEVVTINEEFDSNPQIIKDADFSFSSLSNPSVSDTIYVSHSMSNFECNKILRPGINIFCFKITKPEYKRLGWIKLEWTGTILTILEVAHTP